MKIQFSKVCFTCSAAVILVAIGGLTLSPSKAQAQQENSQEITLDDMSLNFEDLPPQPTQSVVPEEFDSLDVSLEAEMVSPEAVVTTTGTADVPSAPPAADLPAPIVDVGQLEITPETASQITAAPTPVKHSGQYFDSDSLSPSAARRSSPAPREVDPRYEPGSRFVVVRKGAGADSVQARIVSAQRALKLGRYASAMEMYEQLYKKAPKNKQVLMGLAVAQQESGFTDSALATYEELLRLDPKNKDATVNMLGLVKSQYPSVAFRRLKDLWEKYPQNAGVAAQLGLTSAALGNAQEAVRYLGIAASIEPNNANHFYNMAVVSDQAGAYKDAMELYQKALEVDISFGGGRTIPRDQVYDRLANLRRL